MVYTLFFTGLRTGEAVGLRWGAVNLRRATLKVQVSRTLREDNAPKTANSARTVPLRADVAVLRAIEPLRRGEDTFVFTTEAGTPLDEERFVEKQSGVVRNTKELADYCGTSVEMLEKHYAVWMAPLRPEELAALGGAAPASMGKGEAVA